VPVRYPLLALVLLAALSAGGSRPAAAQPSLISADRLDDLGLSPALGRGYGAAANTLYGVCFDKMPTTKGSYDFAYSFEEVTADSVAGSRKLDPQIAEFVFDNMRDRVVVKDKTTRHLHYILGVMSVTSYNAAVDESRATLAKNAVDLLRAGDVIGFLSACGTHYMRTITRKAYYATLYIYSSTENKRSTSFEAQLKRSIMGFHGSVESQEDTVAEQELGREAKRRDLRIISRGIGLTRQKTASLLSFDLASFKAALRVALKAAQSDTAGRVASVEIASWLKNTAVLAAMNLADGKDGATLDGRTRRRFYLNQNAEFYVGLNAQLDELTALEQRAERCRLDLEQRFLDEGGRLASTLATGRVVNHRTGETIPLSTLIEAISEETIDRLKVTVRDFEFGVDDTVGGAAACLAALERDRLLGKLHSDVPACVAASATTVRQAALIEDYCMAELDSDAGEEQATP
jgi:hypothetical protein